MDISDIIKNDFFTLISFLYGISWVEWLKGFIHWTVVTYLIYMILMRSKRQALKKGKAYYKKLRKKTHVKLLVVVAFFLDIWYNFVWWSPLLLLAGAIDSILLKRIIVEVPRELLLTDRLERLLVEGEGVRYWIAHKTCKHLLDPHEEGGHCDRPKTAKR